uniref:RNA polymerase II subunit B1 CTD phosphatase RPAP2 homolog n=1 Tax=Heterorhabditis bacteriophora TaxID=37862 RepID=A0A1I7X7H3_HETBA
MGKGRNKNKEKDAYSGPSHRSRRGLRKFIVETIGEDVEDVDSVAFLDSLEEHIENAGHKKWLFMVLRQSIEIKKEENREINEMFAGDMGQQLFYLDL